MASQRETLARLWARCAALPKGRWLFSRVFGRFVPYSGTIGATVMSLEPGRCVAQLPDRRHVRNHLNSIHAVALVNLGEMTSGLAMTMLLPDEVRGIVTGLEAEYLKKARGLLVAEASVALPALGSEPVDHRVETVIRDEANDVVCRVRTTWRLSPQAGAR